MTYEKRNKYLALVVVAAIGIAATTLTFYFSYHLEKSCIVHSFQNVAYQYSHRIKDIVEGNIFALKSFQDFFNASEKVEREEFERFAQGIFSREPLIYEFGWIPRVLEHDRGALENEAIAQGLKEFKIKEINYEKKFVTAERRQEYFPIYYIAHSLANTDGLDEILGLDIATLPSRRELIDNAIDTGQLACVDNQLSYGKIYARDGFAISSRIFLPIYRRDRPNETKNEKRENFLGFVVLMYRIDDIMKKVLQDIPVSSVNIAVYSSASGEKKLVYSYFSSKNKIRKSFSVMKDEKECSECLFWTQNIPVASSRWSIVFYADLGSFDDQKILLPWGLMLAGFLVTAVYLLYLQNLFDQNEVVENLVSARTRELTLANKEWRETFDSIPDFIFILDKHSYLQKVNASFLSAFNLQEKDVIGKKCFDFLHKTEAPWINCPHQQTIKDQKMHTAIVDDPILAKSLLVTTSPIFDLDGNFFGSVHVAKDITEIKQNQDALASAKKEAEDQSWGLAKTNEAIKLLYKELESKNKELVRLGQLRSNFVSMVSHELRTPLTAIKEGIGIVFDGAAGPVNDEQKDFLDTAKRNVDRLARLINNVLDFQKLDSGKEVLFYQENEINSIVKEVYQTMSPLAKEKQLEFILSIDETIPKIKFDKDKIIQVITNLVNNAVKFTEKGSISIITKKGNNTVEVIVKDTGVGVSESDLARLFNYFEQVGNFKQRRGGTGLGLAICKEIIAMHNGKIWAESEYGKGTALHFVLPIIERRVQKSA